MRIILNADDFGSAPDTVRATIECFAAGALTSASLMVRMPATAEAVAFARAHPEFSFGVHMTFVSDGVERPLSEPAEVPQLIGPDGQFRPSNTVRMLGALRLLSVDQIAREMTAQLAWLTDHGVPISHVDSHGHTHKYAPFRQAMERVLPRFGVRRVRRVQDLYLRPPRRSPNYWLGRYWQAALFGLRGLGGVGGLRPPGGRLLTTDHFYMPTSAGDTDWAEALPGRLPPGGLTLEVGVHPGHEDPWRAAERAAVLRFAQAVRQAGHQIIGWRDLGE